MPGIKFAGAKGLIVTEPSANNRTVFIAMRRDATTGTNVQFGSGNTFTSSHLIDLAVFFGVTPVVQIGGDNTAVPLPAVGDSGILALAAGTATGYFRLNDDAPTVIPLYALGNQWTGLCLGTTNVAQWTFLEVLVYDGIVDSTTETTIRTYLNTRWAIF